MGRGRPPTALGTWGAIRTTRVREGAYRSRTRIRDKDGVTREVTATGTTSAAAERALREKLVDRATPTQQSITADTTIAKLAALWLDFLRDENRIEATTINEYERVLTKVVIPELGGLRLREVTTSRLDLFLVRLRATSASRQRKTKVVIGAMLGLAVRHDALTVNPVQQTSRIHREKSETRSLSLDDLDTVRAALRAWTVKQEPGPKASTDMADIVDLMLATGARIGEVLALRWVDVALDDTRPNLTINGTIKTEPGMGTYRKASPKSDASLRTVVLPDFAIAVLRRRQATNSGESKRRCLPHQERHLAAGQQRGAPLATDPQGHRARLGYPAHVPQDGRDPDRGAGECRDRLPATRPLLPRHHPRVLHLQASDRRRRSRCPGGVGGAR